VLLLPLNPKDIDLLPEGVFPPLRSYLYGTQSQRINARPDQFNVSLLPVNTPEPDNANVILPEQALYLFGIHDT